MPKALLAPTLLLLSLLFVACEQKPQEQPIQEAPPPPEVSVHTVKKQTYPIWVNFSGKTQAVDEVVVRARVTAEILKQHFHAGDRVTKGQLLFELDKSEYQAVYEQKKAILEKNRASLKLAIANVKRYEPLVAENLAPREKLDELQATQKQLEATIKSDKANLESAQLNLEYCEVKASINGSIGKELVMVGNIVQAGEDLAHIINSQELYVNFNPSAREVGLIKQYKSTKNPKVKVHLKETRRDPIELEGSIDFIDNSSNLSTGTVAMRAKIDNHQQLLFPGSFVEIKLFVSDQLPIIAVHPDQIAHNQQGSYLYLVDQNNTLEQRFITTGYSNNTLVIIPEGLNEGDRVVVGTHKRLKNKMPVAPTEVANPIQGA
jgi:RND family efflux transporter MFP subunit